MRTARPVTGSELRTTGAAPAAAAAAADAAASSSAGIAIIASEPPAAAADALLSASASSAVACLSSSSVDPFLALRSECDESVFTASLLARCNATDAAGPILTAALRSNRAIDFALWTENVSILASVLRMLPSVSDEAELTSLLSLLQHRLQQWKPRRDRGSDRIPTSDLLLELLCSFEILAPLTEAQIDFLEQLTATLLSLGADMTAVDAFGRDNTIAMCLAEGEGGQTLLARMLQSPCSGVWSSAAMLTMVWHRNKDNESLLGLLRNSPAPHDAVWASNIACIQGLQQFWTSRLKPVLTDFLVSECGLIEDVADMCLDYVDGVDRANSNNVHAPDAEGAVEESAGAELDADDEVEAELNDAEAADDDEPANDDDGDAADE